MSRRLLLVIVIHTSFLLGACSFTPFLYKVDVVQGNLYSEQQISRIQPGITRSEVRRVLGSTTLSDPFTPNIDVYPYYYRAGETGNVYQGSLTIHYSEAGVVTHVEEKEVSRKE